METQLGHPSALAIGFFFLFVMVTLVITYWAASKTKSTSEFYAAGRSVSGFQNGLALAGDFMSAASFLGIAQLVATGGYDGLIYSVGYLVGWPIVMFLVAEPLRNLGKYTFADVVAFRLQKRPIRTMAAVGSVTTVIIYLVAQMVGGAKLVETMFGMEYGAALLIVGCLMIAYVLFGGMLATTWVQIIKAVLLLSGATLLVFLILREYGFSYTNLFTAVNQMPNGPKLLSPAADAHYKVANSSFDLVSLSIGLMFGTAGLPHILMRFYTVPDAREARKSVFFATGFIGYFYLLTFTIGYGAAVLVPGGLLSDKKFSNMAAPLLAERLGGGAFLGFLSAVAFATILAVVAGLTLAGATAISHDIYSGVIRKGKSTEAEDVKVARASTVVLGIIAVALSLYSRDKNVAFLVGLAFAVAASANFPALLLSVTWKRLTTQGAVASMAVGLFSSVIMIALSPTVWTDVFHFASDPPVPFKNPAIVSMSASFLTAFIVSLCTRDHEAEALFESEKVRTYLGVGAE